LRIHRRSPLACQHPCQQEVVVLSCTGARFATFFLKTKNTRAVLALFADVCRLGRLFADALLSVFASQHPLSARSCHPFLYRCQVCHVLPEDKKHASSVGASFCQVLPSAWRFQARSGGFSTRSRFLVLVNL
jgi:hypothetical protein